MTGEALPEPTYPTMPHMKPVLYQNRFFCSSRAIGREGNLHRRHAVLAGDGGAPPVADGGEEIGDQAGIHVVPPSGMPHDFLAAIRDRQRPTITGEDGMAAVQI